MPCSDGGWGRSIEISRARKEVKKEVLEYMEKAIEQVADDLRQGILFQSDLEKLQQYIENELENCNARAL